MSTGVSGHSMYLLKQLIPESLFSIGKPTHADQTAETAWPVRVADQILRIVSEAGLAILGGDIYKTSENGFIPTYDNWYSDIKPGEDWDRYVQRSFSASNDYLKSSWIKEDYWFVLVVADNPDADQLARSHAR